MSYIFFPLLISFSFLFFFLSGFRFYYRFCCRYYRITVLLLLITVVITVLPEKKSVQHSGTLQPSCFFPWPWLLPPFAVLLLLTWHALTPPAPPPLPLRCAPLQHQAIRAQQGPQVREGAWSQKEPRLQGITTACLVLGTMRRGCAGGSLLLCVSCASAPTSPPAAPASAPRASHCTRLTPTCTSLFPTCTCGARCHA